VRARIRSELRESVSIAILEAAEELIALKGLQGAPLAKIAKRAGVAVGTLYNYFADRDALVRALFEMRRATLRPQLQAAVGVAGAPFEVRLRAFMHDVLAAFEEHRKFVKVAIEAEHLKLSPSNTSQDLGVAIRALVAVGVKERVIAAAHDELLSLVIAGAIRALVLERIRENRELVAADGDAVVSLVLDGARRGAR